jgi:hypothetical protein
VLPPSGAFRISIPLLNQLTLSLPLAIIQSINHRRVTPIDFVFLLYSIARMKDSKDVISDFNSYVNMTADELEGWLKSNDSNSAGWPKDAGEEGGETVGHDSGRKIVEILRSNPQKKADKYTEDQIQHMRKVVAYWYVQRGYGGY